MANIKISFNGTKYAVDESNVAHATDGLKTHLSTNMNGSGSTINFGGTSYHIDSTKLSTSTNDFASYLATIAGDGFKVVVNGVEFSVDVTKMNDAITGLSAMFNEIGTQVEDGPIAGLYETGSNYKTLLKSWDELTSGGAIEVNDGAVSVGYAFPDNFPEKNEYGFYYGVLYKSSYDRGYVFFEDGSFDDYWGDSKNASHPAGSAVYSVNGAYVENWDWHLTFSSGGTEFTDDYQDQFILAQLDRAQLAAGDLLLPNDDSITSIKESAFYEQEFLTGIEIPNSVTSIGDDAFYGCTGLTSVEIPDSVTSIGWSAFNGCTSLTSIEIPDGITSISGSAFAYCTSLTSIVIPDSVTSIEFEAFRGCSNLTNIVFGENSQLTYFGTSTFEDCSSLTSVEIPDGVTELNDYLFKNCTSLTNVIIPNSITCFRRDVFEGCSSLISIEIPGSIGSMYSGVFYDCENLISVTFNSITPPTLVSGAAIFGNNPSSLVIYVPAESVEAYKAASGWSSYATKIQAIPET